MTDKDLRKLGRIEMLEMLIEATKAQEALERRVAELNKELDEAQKKNECGKMNVSAITEQISQELEEERRRSAEAEKQAELAQRQLSDVQKMLETERARANLLDAELQEEKKASAAAQQKIDMMTIEMDNKIIVKDKAGTLADAAIYINGVFEAAQKAADQYLASVEFMRDDLEGKRDVILSESREKAEQMIREAELRCEVMEEQTRRRCEEMKIDADKNVWQKWSMLSEQLQQISSEIRNSVNVPKNGDIQTD